MAEFRALQEKYKFQSRHIAAQLSAFAAAKVFVEGLTRAGRDLTREKFINALDTLYNYETGVTTPNIWSKPQSRGLGRTHRDLRSREERIYGTWLVNAY